MAVASQIKFNWRILHLTHADESGRLCLCFLRYTDIDVIPISQTFFFILADRIFQSFEISVTWGAIVSRCPRLLRQLRECVRPLKQMTVTERQIKGEISGENRC